MGSFYMNKTGVFPSVRMVVNYMKRNFKKTHLRNGLVLIHIVFALIGFYTFIFNYQLSANLLIQQTLNKQLILAKSGSTSVENLLKNIQGQLSSFIFTFTPISDTASIDISTTRKEFAAYMQNAQLPINGIALYNESGKITILANRQNIHIGEGEDFSQTSYIHWSKDPKNKGKTYISTPYIGTTGASIGKIILFVAQPVYFGNSYKGTLAIKLLVDDFRQAFISPLASNSDESSFIVDTNGILLAGDKALLNQNLFVYANKKKWKQYKDFIQKLNLALNAQQTQTAWTFQTPQGKTVLSNVGVSKIDIPNTDKDLYMVVTTAQSSSLVSLQPLRVYAFVWLGFGVITTILGGFIVIALSAD